MPSFQRTRNLALSILMLGVLPITGCGADSGEPDDQAEDEGIEVTSAESALTGALPSVFTATLQNASHDGSTNECVIFGGNGQQPYPERYLWGAGDNGYCGFASKSDMLANKQAVFTFRSLGDDLYTISNASHDGSHNECLMTYGVAVSESPSRFMWGSDNGYCGFDSKAALLANKQAVWRVTSRGGNKFTITHALNDQCLIFTGNGQAINPTRHLWDNGANGMCGWDAEQNLLNNKQAIYTITVQEDLTPPPPPETTLPSHFTATLQNSSRNGTTNECLIFGGNGQQPYPERYLWGAGDNGYCGFPSKNDMIANKQAVFTFKSLGGDLYTISNASRDGSHDECLMTYGVDGSESPSRFMWGDDNGYCGFASKNDLLANKQAVWKVKSRGGDKITITHALTNQCLIIGGGGQAVNPIRHLWDGGANGDCGFDSEQAMLDNGQAAWTLKIQEDLGAGAPPQEITPTGKRIFRTGTTGSPISFSADASAVVDGNNSVSIAGAVTVRADDNDPGIELANANITLAFDDAGYVSTLIGSAKVSLPSSDTLSGLSFGDLIDVTVGLDSGANLKDQEIEAPMKDERQYLLYHVAAGLSASYGPISISAPGGSDTLIVVDPRDPSVYFHGDLSGVRGLSALGDVGIGLSAQGLLPFEFENTWGIEGAAQPFDGNLLVQASGQLPTRLPLSLNGEVMVKMPRPNVPSDVLRFGVNGQLGVQISFAKDMASFSVPLASASAGGQFSETISQDDLYFSGDASFQAIMPSLPGTFPIKLDAGVLVAGRLSGAAANNFLHLQGNATYGGFGVESADLIFKSSGNTVSGRFLFPGFSANLSGTVTPWSASLNGQATANITIPATKEVTEYVVIGTKSITNGAICGWNEVECGTQWIEDAFLSAGCYIAKGLCSGTGWCPPPPECAAPVYCPEPKSCSQEVWDYVTHTEADPVTFHAVADIHVSSPDAITIVDAGSICPAVVGGCALTGEGLTSGSPTLCVNTGIFGKYCAPLQAN